MHVLIAPKHHHTTMHRATAPNAQAYRINMIGPTAAGKTSLAQQYAAQCNGRTLGADQARQCKPTAGVGCHRFSTVIGDTTYNWTVWDESGAERYRPVVRASRQSTHAIVGVVDLAALTTAGRVELATVDAVRDPAAYDGRLAAVLAPHLDEFRQARRDNDALPWCLIGNKIDEIGDNNGAPCPIREALRCEFADGYFECSVHRDGAAAAFGHIFNQIATAHTRQLDGRRRAHTNGRPLAPLFARRDSAIIAHGGDGGDDASAPMITHQPAPGDASTHSCPCVIV